MLLSRVCVLPELCVCTMAEESLILVAQNYLEAAELYSNAIALDPTDKTFWLNRAVARIKLEEFGYAISDVSMYASFHPFDTRLAYSREQLRR